MPKKTHKFPERYSPGDLLPTKTGQIIRAAREAKGLTLGVLAAMIGVHPTLAHHWELGRRGMSHYHLAAVNAVLGLNLGSADAMSPKDQKRLADLQRQIKAMAA